MKLFLDDYGLKWITTDNRDGEFKLETLMNDLKIATDPLWVPIFNILD